MPAETRAELERLVGAVRARRRASAGAAGDDARARRRRRRRRRSSASTASSSTRRRRRGRQRLDDFARRGRVAGRASEAADVAFHYRTRVRRPAGRGRSSARSRSARATQGFRPRWGRKVLEVPPAGRRRQGHGGAAAARRRRPHRALYAGDDTTDLDAFRGARRARARACASPSRRRRRPPQLAAAADLVLGGPASLLELLRAALSARRRGRPRAASRALRRAASCSTWEGEICEPERAMATLQPAAHARRDAVHPRRRAARADPQAALRAAGIWRPPGGGIKPGEDFVDGVLREALEETGLDVELERYLVARRRASSASRTVERAAGGRTSSSPRRRDDELEPRDTEEIAAARWGTLDELAGPLRERLLATRPRVLALPRRAARRGRSRLIARGLEASSCRTPRCRRRRSPSSSSPSPTCRSASRRSRSRPSPPPRRPCAPSPPDGCRRAPSSCPSARRRGSTSGPRRTASRGCASARSAEHLAEPRRPRSRAGRSSS